MASTEAKDELRELRAQVGEGLEIGFAEWANHIAAVNLEIAAAKSSHSTG